MSKITTEMKALVSRERLGFLATVCDDGSPNLSPKGLTFVLDDDHLVIGDVRSPTSVANLRVRPLAEVNVVDPVLRKGFRFKGSCGVCDEGPEFARLVRFLRDHGARSEIRSVIVMKVSTAAALVSPVYDSGATEAEVKAEWLSRINRTHSD